jgi:hypothetical protein
VRLAINLRSWCVFKEEKKRTCQKSRVYTSEYQNATPQSANLEEKQGHKTTTKAGGKTQEFFTSKLQMPHPSQKDEVPIDGSPMEYAKPWLYATSIEQRDTGKSHTLPRKGGKCFAIVHVPFTFPASLSAEKLWA